MIVRIRYFLICLIFLVFLSNCNTSEKRRTGLEIRGYRFDHATKTENLVFSFTEDDILCVDWKNQSYQLYDSALLKLKEKNFTGGYLNEFIRIVFDDSIISEVNILNSYSSNHKYWSNSPFTCVYGSTNNILTSDNWFIVNIYGDKTIIYKKLFNERIYSYLKNKGLLTGTSWKCNTKSEYHGAALAHNNNFDIDFCRRFYKEKISASNLRFLCHSRECEVFVDSIK